MKYHHSGRLYQSSCRRPPRSIVLSIRLVSRHAIYAIYDKRYFVHSLVGLAGKGGRYESFSAVLMLLPLYQDVDQASDGNYFFQIYDKEVIYD